MALSTPVLPTGAIAGVSSESLTFLQNGIAGVSSAARTAWDALRYESTVFAGSSLALLRSPAVELYTTAHLAGVVTLPPRELPELDDEIAGVLDDTVDELEPRLAALDHELVDVYRGAITAIVVGGPDWQRHSMASFRELTTHVLHKLAPDDRLLPAAQPTDLADGRPTRRARLRFIFAGVAGPEMATFFEADMKAAIELFDLLNSGTHKLGNKATPQQLHYLRGRVAGLIASMLSARGL